jgi:uncharacterized protein (DUF58 family)
MHSPVIRGSRRYLRPETIARIARLELRARSAVEGGFVGIHKSPSKGHSVEFLQHREYVRGDDLRRVDWKVWGRQDKLTIKEFEEETTLRLALLIDASASMNYAGGNRPSKYDCGAVLATALAWLALSHGDAAGASLFDDRVRNTVPARHRRSQLTEICDLLEAPRGSEEASRSEGATGSEGATDFLGVLRRAAESLPRRGLVIIISDLLGDRDGLLRGLRLLARRGHDLAILHVMDDDELDFTFEGPTRFEGLELPAHLACNPRALREGYLEAVEAFLAEVRHAAGSVQADYALVRTGEPPEQALVRFLARRTRQA